MKKHPMLILYGSQTGTAQDVAERLSITSIGTYMECMCCAFDEYDISKLISQQLVVCVCSTTGQGDAPDNMKKFWNFIMQKRLPSDSLDQLRFAVLGLGDSSYTKYNFVAKKLNRRIKQLGGNPLLELYLADDQHDFGADITVDKWFNDIWNKILNIYPLAEHAFNPLDPKLPPLRFQITGTNNIEDRETSSNSDYAEVMLTSNDRVTSNDHFQDTRLIKFNTSSKDAELLYYKPGDIAMILPSNLQSNADEFIKLFPHINPNKIFQISNNFVNFPLNPRMPNVTTFKELVTNYFDVLSIPKRSFFQILQHIATDELEKEKLQEFASVEGSEERINYVNRPRRSIIEVFQDFHNTAKQMTVERLIDVMPIIQPRAFSIASSPTKHFKEIHLLVAIVHYKTKLKRLRQGLCSTWLASLKSGDTVFLKTKTGGMKFPESISKNPVIMIGPGTGVSPFRSYIHESANQSKMTLIFGCRYKEKDFYFEKEWDQIKSLNLLTAFSRDQENKIYVQDVIELNGEVLWNAIHNEKACVYIAGNSKQMPDAVKLAFSATAQKFGDLSRIESDLYIENLQKIKRYQQETWS